MEYEVLRWVANVLDAMKDDAPILHERLAVLSNPDMEAGMAGALQSDDAVGKSTNIASTYLFEVGELEKGFQAADVIVEHEYTTETVHQGYIEPHSATAYWSADGNLTIWCSSQGHFAIRDYTARVLGIPISKVKVIPMEIGGGFGGKTLVYLEPIAALFSKKTGQPVKLTMSRAEVFEGTGPTSGGYLRVKIGANKEGRDHSRGSLYGL